MFFGKVPWDIYFYKENGLLTREADSPFFLVKKTG